MGKKQKQNPSIFPFFFCIFFSCQSISLVTDKKKNPPPPPIT